jgi:hypothetical protein
MAEASAVLDVDTSTFGAFVTGTLKGVGFDKWESADKARCGSTLCLMVDTGKRLIWVHVAKEREEDVRSEYRGKDGQVVRIPVSTDKFWVAGPGTKIERV